MKASQKQVWDTWLLCFLSSQGCQHWSHLPSPREGHLSGELGSALHLGSRGYIYLDCHMGLCAPGFQARLSPRTRQASHTGESCTCLIPSSHHDQGGALLLRAHGVFLELHVSIHYPFQQNILHHRDTRLFAQNHTASGFEPMCAPRTTLYCKH